MVIIQREDDTKAVVETILEEHEGSDVDKLKRQELLDELIKFSMKTEMFLPRICQQVYLRYVKAMNFILILRKELNL